MSDNVTTDSGTPAENYDEPTVADVSLKTSKTKNLESLTLRTTAETNERNTGDIVAACTAEAKSNISSQSSEDVTGDAHFQSRTASRSFNSDATESSFVVAEGKQDNLPAVNYDTVAGKSKKPDIPETEIDPFTQSVKYLEKHQILRLFQNFAAQIVYKRPENPLQYLVEELERRRRETATDSSTNTQDSGLLS